MALGACVAQAAQVRKAIPERFQGEWSKTLASCQDLRTDDVAIRITSSGIYFYESMGKVVTVATHGSSDLAIILNMGGEGEAWMQTIQLRLSKDRNTLVDVTARKPGIVRVRCPRKTQKLVHPIKNVAQQSHAALREG
jgi:hypothetical protein